MNRKVSRTCTALAVIAWACWAALAVDPPDVRINPATGLIETVDATWLATNYEVRHTVANGKGQIFTSTLLTTNKVNDLDPRIALSSGGAAYVAWWRDTTPNVTVFRVRASATGSWGGERTVGLATESNSRPRVTSYGNHMWVAYQIQSPKERSVSAQIIDDDPEPVRTIVASTSYPGDLDIQLPAEAGHLWVTWIDTASRVGYSEYLSDERFWAIPAYESFATDSVSAARDRIRARILGSSN
jgi:hypothetical protein